MGSELVYFFLVKRMFLRNLWRFATITVVVDDRGFLVQIAQQHCPLQLNRGSVTMSTLEARQEY